MRAGALMDPRASSLLLPPTRLRVSSSEVQTGPRADGVVDRTSYSPPAAVGGTATRTLCWEAVARDRRCRYGRAAPSARRGTTRASARLERHATHVTFFDLRSDEITR